MHFILCDYFPFINYCPTNYSSIVLILYLVPGIKFGSDTDFEAVVLLLLFLILINF